MKSGAIMTRGLAWFLLAGALLTGLGCSDYPDLITTVPALTCEDGGAAAANTVALTCGETTGDTQQVNVVLGGPATVSGLSFNVMYDGSSLDYDSYDASTVHQFFPGALVSIVPSIEPNSVPGYQDVIVAIQMTGGTGLTGDPGQHVVLTLNFRRISGAVFGPTPLTFNLERTLTATPATAGTTFASDLVLAYQ